MRFQWQHFLLVGVIVLLAGCNRETLNPTAPTSDDARMLQETPTKPSDDTNDSDILTTPYRAYRMVAVGDSITYGTGGSRSVGGYPGILQRKLRVAGYSVSLENAGVPGATSSEMLSSIRRRISGADVMLLMIGTNDILHPQSCVSSVNCRVADNIRVMLNTAIQMGVKPVLGTVTPKNPSDVYAYLNPRIRFLNTQLVALAAEYQIAIADTYTAISDNGGSRLYYDKHHFTDAGYSVLADEWYRVLAGSVLYPLPDSL